MADEKRGEEGEKRREERRRRRLGWGVLMGASFTYAAWLYSPESKTPVRWGFSEKDKDHHDNIWSLSITNQYGGPPQAIAEGFYPFEAIVEVT